MTTYPPFEFSHFDDSGQVWKVVILPVDIDSHVQVWEITAQSEKGDSIRKVTDVRCDKFSMRLAVQSAKGIIFDYNSAREEYQKIEEVRWNDG